MAINLEGLSTKELAALINDAKKRKTKLAKRKPIGVVRKKVTTLLRNEGFTVAELFGGVSVAASGERKARAPAKARKAIGKVAPKYRNPDNPSETWTGRGKPKAWLAAKVAGGAKLEDFLIKG
jgi:DNA-binding protein H-NS